MDDPELLALERRDWNDLIPRETMVRGKSCCRGESAQYLILADPIDLRDDAESLASLEFSDRASDEGIALSYFLICRDGEDDDIDRISGLLGYRVEFASE